VAYGKGGTEPTITDANLCLGRLDPGSLLGGRMKVDMDAARAVVRERIATPLGISLEAAALGIIQIANANMSRAIRSVSVERGYDLGEFALCAFGGAGPLHAAEVAVECGIPVVLAPREPGTLCARGILLSDISSDYVRSHFADASQGSWLGMLGLFEEMTREADAWLVREGVPAARRRFKRIIDARYVGQNFEVKVDGDGLGPDDLAAVAERFHEAHAREYGYALRDRALELVTCRLQAIGEVPKAPQARVEGGASLAAAEIGRRRMYVDATHGWMDALVYQRERLPVGVDIAGPVVVNEMSSTTLIFPGQVARIDAWGNLIVRIGR
jgi:N-methylhydantoinase A